MSESRPISGKALFDTNAARGLIRRIPLLIAALDPECEVILPLAVVGELLYGAEHAANPDRQRTRVLEFVSRAAVLLPDEHTAGHYARIRADLRRQGRLSPENDLWIAATTYHFERIGVGCTINQLPMANIRVGQIIPIKGFRERRDNCAVPTVRAAAEGFAKRIFRLISNSPDFITVRTVLL